MLRQIRLRLRLSSMNSHVQLLALHLRIRRPPIAGEQVCSALEDGKKNSIESVSCTRPFGYHTAGTLPHVQ